MLTDWYPTPRMVETMARATWTRCRSLQERKSKATWDSISEETRAAWRKGAAHDLLAARSVDPLVTEVRAGRCAIRTLNGAMRTMERIRATGKRAGW